MFIMPLSPVISLRDSNNYNRGGGGGVNNNQRFNTTRDHHHENVQLNEMPQQGAIINSPPTATVAATNRLASVATIEGDFRGGFNQH